MSYARPTLAEILRRVRNDLLSRMRGDDVLRRADAEVNASAVSGAVHGLYGFIDWVARQILPDTSDRETLIRQGALYRIYTKDAGAAVGTVTFTVQPGAVIPAGVLLQALDGQQYATTADATVVSGLATAPVEALVAGLAGNRVTGEALALVSPVDGVQPTATASALTGGADVESEDELRARVIARMQQPPQGGCAYDYATWALEVEGVTRAWVYPQELGAGTVTVRFMRDGDASPIPEPAEVAAVQDYINARRPVTAQVTVVAPVAEAVNFTLTGLDPATSTVRAAVETELADLLRREAVPGGTILLSHIRAAISAAAGENDFTLTTPTANIARTTGKIATLGTITWA